MIEDWALTDLQVPPAPGSLMRSIPLGKTGKFRVSRRDCEIYSIQITSAGAWGKIFLYNGKGRMVFPMLSAFTGSFWLGGHCEDGLIVELLSATNAPLVNVNFRERDTKIV